MMKTTARDSYFAVDGRMKSHVQTLTEPYDICVLCVNREGVELNLSPPLNGQATLATSLKTSTSSQYTGNTVRERSGALGNNDSLGSTNDGNSRDLNSATNTDRLMEDSSKKRNPRENEERAAQQNQGCEAEQST